MPAAEKSVNRFIRITEKRPPPAEWQPVNKIGIEQMPRLADRSSGFKMSDAPGEIVSEASLPEPVSIEWA